MAKRGISRFPMAWFLVAAGVCFPGCPFLNPVFFRDAALERAIREELTHPLGFLTEDVLLQLETLDARGRGIRDLSGIEFCRNLIWLDLDTNSISDLTPLQNLTSLAILNLDSNEVTDISPLAGLLNLDGLSLFDNQVGDIGALVTNARDGGLGEGDWVILDDRHLSEVARVRDVPELAGRGVNVIVVVPEEPSDGAGDGGGGA